MASASQAQPQSPAAPPADVPHIIVANRGLLIAGVMLASVMQLIDATIANVALPNMQTTLGAAPDTITWVLTSYIIASAVAMPITGWLADKIGSRKLLLGSVLGFMVASVLCGAAQSLSDMVVYRIFQGISGAFLLPLGQAVMLDITPRSKHPQMMAIWGAGVVLGPIVGPILGGYLTEYWNWRWVFYVNVPIGALALFILFAELPVRPQRQRKFDLLGFCLVGITLSALQLLLDRGPHVDWFASMESWTYLGITLSTAWMATIHFITGKNPLFDHALFADRNLMVALLFLIVAGFVMFASMALLPPMLQNLLGYDAIDTGAILMARGIGVLVSMQLASLLMRLKVDTRILVSTGFTITAFSLYMMSGWSLSIGAYEVIEAGLVQGLGIGLVFIPLNTLAFATLPPHLRTDASSITNLARTVGSSIGIAIMAFMLSRSIQTSHADLAGNLDGSAGAIANLGTIDRYQEAGQAVLGIIDLEINRQAAMVGYINDFWMMMWLTLCSVPLIVLMRKKQH